MKRSTIKALGLIFILAFAAPYLSAKGASDGETAYRNELTAQFKKVLSQVSNGKMEPLMAQEQIREFQQSRNRVNQQTLDEMAQCLNQVGAGTMTEAEAQARVRSALMKASSSDSGDKLMEQDRDQLQDGTGTGPDRDQDRTKSGSSSSSGKKS